MKEINNGYSTQHKRRIIEGMTAAWDYHCQDKGVNYDIEIEANLGIVHCSIGIVRYGKNATVIASEWQRVEPQQSIGEFAYKHGWDAATKCFFEVYHQDQEHRRGAA